MGLCPLGISRVDPARICFPLDHIIKRLLTNLFLSKWLNIGLVLFFAFFSYLNKFCECLLQIFLEWVVISSAMNGFLAKSP